MDEEESTPRSSRKKKSTLAKLVASKGRRRDDAGSKTSLTESHPDTSPKYPIDANVEIQSSSNVNGSVEESDEDVGGGVRSDETSWRGRVPSDGTIDKFQSLQMDNKEDADPMEYSTNTDSTSEQGDIDATGLDSNLLEKRAKRHREIYSSAEEVNGESVGVKHRKPPVRPPRRLEGYQSPMDEGESDDIFQQEPSRPQYDSFKPNFAHRGNVDGEDSETGEVGSENVERTRAVPTDHYEERRNSAECDEGESCASPDLSDSFGTQQSLAAQYKEILSQQEGLVGNSLDAEETDEISDAVCSLKENHRHPPQPSQKVLETFFNSVTSQSGVMPPQDRPWSAVPHTSTQFDMMSQRSYQSTSVLPLITTKEARNRSFLVGSLSHNSSLLGAEELDRFFPDRKMRILVGTWNMCEMKKLPESLDDFLLPESADYIPDMYIIGTQESHANRREWEISLQETIGPQHVLFQSVGYGVLYLSVFLRRDLIWFCSMPEEAFVSTRPGPTGIKTKGGVAVSFTFFGTSLLFIGSHLSPHDGRLKDRVADYHKIANGINLPNQVVSNQYLAQHGDATARFDCVFWCGDLNFRLEKERNRVDQAMEGINAQDVPSFEDLMRYDELFRARNEGLAFQEFQEGRIKFRPTYKYDKGSDEYDSSKKMRIPSYTDRVLFRCKKKHAISCLHYDSVQSMKESDHRPVFGLYEVSLRPGRDTVPLAGGLFERDIWLEANKRRAMRQNLSVRNDKSSTVCVLQ